MARISRLVVPKYPHPITQRGVRSMAIFPTDEDRQAYLQFLAEEAERFGVEILAWSLITGIFLRASRGGGLQRINNIGIMSPEFRNDKSKDSRISGARMVYPSAGEPFRRFPPVGDNQVAPIQFDRLHSSWCDLGGPDRLDKVVARNPSPSRAPAASDEPCYFTMPKGSLTTF